MKTLSLVLVRIGRIVTSFRFAVAVLLAIAVSCFWRGFAPDRSDLEKFAAQLRDPKFQTWYATVGTEREKAAVRASLDACSRRWGGEVWASHVAEAVDETGKPRFYDLAEMALSIESGEDRKAFAEAHADAYAVIVESGSAEFAAEYVARLDELRKTGGRDWRVARSSPLAVAVYAATKGDRDLWAWYLDNREWADDFLVALHADPEADDPGAALASLLAEFRRRPKVYRALRDEVAGWSEDKGGMIAEDLDAGEFLSVATGTVSLFGDTFDVLCEANVPFGEALDVLANNIADLDFGPEDAGPEEIRRACRETGVELVNVYRSHRAVWDAAASPGGGGAIKYFRDVPQHAEAVLAAFGDADVLPFLMENYADSLELLAVASEVLERHEAVGWAMLETFAGNSEFKRALLHPKIGHLVVPFAVNRAIKEGKDTSKDVSPLSTAVSICLDNPGWIKRELNSDGSYKPETETIAEVLPFVGGIVTVAKHQFRGEPVTMGEIGWAAFDVVDDAFTVAALVASGGTATPALAAKKAATQSAKQGAKVTVKQGSKQLARQTGKSAARYAARTGGKAVVRESVEAATKREAKSLARRALVKIANGTGRAVSWTIRTTNRTVRLVASPLQKTAKAWRNLPPSVRKTVLRTAAATMFFVAVTARTLQKLPEAIHTTLVRIGTDVGTLVNETVKGMGDCLREAIIAALGLQMPSVRIPNLVAGSIALIAIVLLFAFHRRRSSLPPARLA